MGMREEFEAWHAMNCSTACPHAGSEYKAWVASRAALVIELPFAFKDCDSRDATDVREAIHAVGVSYK